MLNHIGTKTLQTERLLLRKFVITDAPYMFSNWSNDADAVKYLSWNAHKNPAESEEFLEKLIERYEKVTTYTWTVAVKKIDEPVGYINIHAIHDYHKRGEISYCIGRNFWNRGYATEALKMIVDFAFNEVGFNRLIGLHDVLNPVSGRVLMKAGFKYEGILKQHEVDKNGRTQDLCIYAVLREDIG